MIETLFQDPPTGGGDPTSTIGTLDSVVLGVVEGLTEFVPVSSTGHLIVTNRLLGSADPAYEVVIQVGAITAIVVLYWRRILTAAKDLFAVRGAGGGGLGTNLFVLLAVASVPAVVLGLGLGDLIEAALFRPEVVATTMVLGGVALLILERWEDRKAQDGRAPTRGIDGLRWRDALWIGLFQCLALVPGTSRSGATIAGALLLGCRRPAAAEFSFLLGLPILYGACLKKLYEDWDRLSGPMLQPVVIGTIASFVTALAIVVPFVRFLQRHTFRPFAFYRIGAGLLVFALWASGWLGEA